MNEPVDFLPADPLPELSALVEQKETMDRALAVPPDLLRADVPSLGQETQMVHWVRRVEP